MTVPIVGIVFGSESDRETMAKAVETLESLGVPCEARAISAHREPAETAAYARSAEGRGIRVLIAGAGLSAALPGVLAAHTLLPVIGVPLARGALQGMDSLLSIVQMPPGVPVATVGLDAAKNAALLAAEILALSDPALRERLARARPGVSTPGAPPAP